ncbi:flagellar hook-associated protein FlgL [Brevibacillus thermoruber]|jgi:flagellar hook-associated protein 3 FlgL|uniref:flagellar hook-associated protein FlgL n=1 Tax=Brevibacillus thermoruber TaxID=33942 RepID=UPI0004024F9C|nr:flagellar hook-associated protein FlgL [Brevibacillus thermoruber]
MAMRVTQNMLNNNMLRNLHNSMGNMNKLQEQLSSGKKISKPSDDPVIAARAVYYRSAVIENEQYVSNLNQARSWLEMSDKALEEGNNVLQRVRELLIYSGDPALGPDSLKAMATEIAQLKDHLGTVANQTINGRYIFAGTDTLTPPYDKATGDFTNTNAEQITLEVSQQIFLPINPNGQAVFNYPDPANNVFKLLDKIITDLSNGQPVTQYLDDMTSQIDNMVRERAALGARQNRVDLIEDRLLTEGVTITELMSENEDADIAKVITDLKTQENVHRAALGAGARIIQPSLLDFLR